MTITAKSIKLLWANASGRCSFPGCGIKLTVEQAAEVTPHTLGEMAHIKGRMPGASRYDKNQTDTERDDYTNLILLCPTHHTLIDKPENLLLYSVDALIKMKTEHEKDMDDCFTRQNLCSIEDLKDTIAIYLAENRLSWEQYGPLSVAARKNPLNEAIYALWLSERLSTIVPNNRKINRLLERSRDLFDRQSQMLISQFINHVKSYELWVKDEIPYQAVKPFPIEFEKLILEKSDASV